jgi:hypothetical protein
MTSTRPNRTFGRSVRICTYWCIFGSGSPPRTRDSHFQTTIHSQHYPPSPPYRIYRYGCSSHSLSRVFGFHNSSLVSYERSPSLRSLPHIKLALHRLVFTIRFVLFPICPEYTYLGAVTRVSPLSRLCRLSDTPGKASRFTKTLQGPRCYKASTPQHLSSDEE